MEIIVDDFLIHGKDQTDTDQKLRVVFDKSRELGLKLQSSISKFHSKFDLRFKVAKFLCSIDGGHSGSQSF